MQTVSSRSVPTDVSVTGYPMSKIGENDLLVKGVNIERTEFFYVPIISLGFDVAKERAPNCF